MQAEVRLVPVGQVMAPTAFRGIQCAHESRLEVRFGSTSAVF